MPCNIMSGWTPTPDYAAERMAREADLKIGELTRRVAELEQALCGLCQMLERAGLQPELTDKHPQLQAWFDAHKARPGCEAGR
jgi:hypothetical protein